AMDHNLTLTITDGSDDASVTVDETKFGLLFGGGGILPFSRNLGLCLIGSIRLKPGTDSRSYSSSDPPESGGSIFGAAISLVVLLGD
ncbi:MAG TPA: hypothetical protein VM118_13970, partial [Acidobacteriota bacterium]|nr:hypothetical protein [Acidobacteriota bacterium]